MRRYVHARVRYCILADRSEEDCGQTQALRFVGKKRHVYCNMSKNGSVDRDFLFFFQIKCTFLHILAVI